MKTLIIGYDLKAGADYEPLITAIKKFGNWWHFLDSTWLVRTSMSTTETRDYLAPLFGRQERLFVDEIDPNRWATKGLNQEAIAWLRRGETVAT